MTVQDRIGIFQTWQTTDTANFAQEPRTTQIRIRIRIPRNYHQEPVISQLISHYHLIVNITAAQLGDNTQYDGLFELELKGAAQQIQDALIYLNELDLEIWQESNDLQDGW